MSTSHGRRLHSRVSFSITHSALSLDTRSDMPRPHVFEQGLHGVVWVMQFLSWISLVERDTETDSINEKRENQQFRNINTQTLFNIAYPPQGHVWGWSCAVCVFPRRTISRNTRPVFSHAWVTDTTPGVAGTQYRGAHTQWPHSHTDSDTYNWVGNSGHCGKSHPYTHSLFP